MSIFKITSRSMVAVEEPTIHRSGWKNNHWRIHDVGLDDRATAKLILPTSTINARKAISSSPLSFVSSHLVN